MSIRNGKYTTAKTNKYMKEYISLEDVTQEKCD
jgi:hypothetical protein